MIPRPFKLKLTILMRNRNTKQRNFVRLTYNDICKLVRD